MLRPLALAANDRAQYPQFAALVDRLQPLLPVNLASVIEASPSSMKLLAEYRAAKTQSLTQSLLIDTSADILANNDEKFPALAARLEAHIVSLSDSDIDGWCASKSGHSTRALDKERALLSAMVTSQLSRHYQALQSIVCVSESESEHGDDDSEENNKENRNHHRADADIGSVNDSKDMRPSLLQPPSIHQLLRQLLGEATAADTHTRTHTSTGHDRDRDGDWPSLELLERRLTLLSQHAINTATLVATDARRSLASRWLAAKLDCLELKLSLQCASADIAAASVSFPLPNHSREQSSVLYRQSLLDALRQRLTTVTSEVRELEANIERAKRTRSSDGDEWAMLHREWASVKQIKREKLWALKQLQ